MNKYGIKACFICGVFFKWEELVCGHWQKRRHSGTRYSEINCQSICGCCNDESNPDNDNLFEFKLRQLYGDGLIDDLIITAHHTVKFNDQDYARLVQTYKSLTPIQAIRL